jgi:choline dehydrogenase-like flavoprotein
MIIDARSVPSGTEIFADICIVGGGAAGITVAQTFANSPHKIVVVESGGLEFDENTQSLYDGNIVGLDPGYTLSDSRLRYFGGSTNHWTGQCHPLDTIDFEERDWLPMSGWPISRKDMAGYYESARTLIGLPPFNIFDSKSKGLPTKTAIDPLLESNFFRSQSSFEPRVFNFSPLNFADAYENGFARSHEIDVYLNANATSVLSNPYASKAIGISAVTLTGRNLKFRARHYVLALGGLETPRLLLSSNDVRPAGLGNDLDIVGRYFQEHPFFGFGHIALSNNAPCATPDPAPRYEQLIRVAIPEAAQRSNELLNSAFLVSLATPSTVLGIPETGRAIFRDRQIPEELRNKTINAFLGMENPLRSLLCSISGHQANGDLLSVTWGAEQVPNRHSRVALTDERDQLGMRKINLDWQFSELDHANLVKTSHWIGREVGRLGIGRMRQPDWFQNSTSAALQHNTGGNFHHMGTLRVSDNPHHGVVDANCRVHGIENLYVAGSAVFPTSGYANPTLTIVALALRLADHLKNRLI